MKLKLTMVGIILALSLSIPAGIAAAKDDHTTSPTTAYRYVNNGSVIASQNTGDKVQRKFTEDGDAVTSKDNLKEFTQQQNKEINDFRKLKIEELKQKTQAIRTQRKTCTEKIKAFTLERRTRNLEFAKSCTTNSADCKAKHLEIEKETRDGLAAIRLQCFNNERKVLGLSTMRVR